MTIDPIKLKAAAERLEWVLEQYPDEPIVQNMLEGLRPLIKGAKAGEVKEAVESIPFGYSFSEELTGSTSVRMSKMLMSASPQRWKGA